MSILKGDVMQDEKRMLSILGDIFTATARMEETITRIEDNIKRQQ